MLLSFLAPGISLAVAATFIALVSAFAALWLTGARQRLRFMIPLSAGMLLAVTAFGLLPELWADLGAARAVFFFGAGYFLLFGINRYVYPVCPSCSHGHDHSGCETLLHGFAAPLVAAAAVHSLLDGWSIAGTEARPYSSLHMAVPLAIAFHKIPEGVALGALLRASLNSRLAAFNWSVAGQSPTVLGALLAGWIAPVIGFHWVGYPLALAAGALFFLASHALHNEWRRRGPTPALVPALVGAAGVAALQQGLHALL